MAAFRPELLAPAGNIEKLETAVHFGADAVYAGVKGFSLRSISEFDEEDIEKSLEYVRRKGKKLYLCLNLFARSGDVKRLNELLPFFKKHPPDAFIVSDPGVVGLLRDSLPNIPLHLSTQANTTNSSSVKFWKNSAGIKRINLARELKLEEIREIRREVSDIELEVFIHGALCLSYSGKCYLSEYLNSRSANRGDCAQPCRWKYSLVEETRENIYFPVEEDGKGTFIMNYRDLCLAGMMPELLSSGIDSFKIEGRNKSSYYIACVVRVYREIIDCFMSEGKDFVFRKEWIEELQKTSHRGYTEGFVGNYSEKNSFFYDDNYIQSYKPIAIIKEVTKKSGKRKMIKIKIKNRIKKGDSLECISPGMNAFPFKLGTMTANNGKTLEIANPGISVNIEVSSDEVSPGDFLRKKED